MAGCGCHVQLQESQRMAEEKRAVMVSIPGPELLELLELCLLALTKHALRLP